LVGLLAFGGKSHSQKPNQTHSGIPTFLRSQTILYLIKVIDFFKKKTYSTIDIAMNNLTILMLRLDGWLEWIVRLVE